MSTRNGMRRCCATGTMAAVLPESKEPINICAPWLMTRSASVRPTSGFVWVSPTSSSSFIPPSALIPPAALMASAAIWAPSRQACPGSASGPVTGWTTPTLKAGACARKTAGKPVSAVAPAAAPAVLRNVLRSVPLPVRRSLITTPLSELSNELLGDDHTLDLVGALVDLGDLGVAHVALDRKVPGVAVAAQDLHGVRGDLHGRVRGQALRDRGFHRGVGFAAVDERRRVVHGEPGGVGGDGHVRQHELDALERGDRLVEGAPLPRVGACRVERGLGDADRLRADGRPRLLERPQRDGEAPAFLAQTVLHRH